MNILRHDGSEGTFPMHELSSEIEIKTKEIEELTFERVLQLHEQTVVDLTRQQLAMILSQLDRDIPKSQKIDSGGKPLDARMVIDMYKAIELDFNPDGTPHELQALGGITKERLESIELEFKDNPSLQKEWESVVLEKKESWRAREASRKLVG